MRRIVGGALLALAIAAAPARAEPEGATVAAGGMLYQLRPNGSIWRRAEAACSGRPCPGWQALDVNSAAIAIAVRGGEVFQLRRDGQVLRLGTPSCRGDACTAWEAVADDPRPHDAAVWVSVAGDPSGR